MNPLEARKRLLVAESDLNRTRLAEDLAALGAGIRTTAVRARAFGAFASSAAVLVAGLVAVRRRRSGKAGAGPSWLRALAEGAGLLSTLWLAVRPPFTQGKPRTDAPDRR